MPQAGSRTASPSRGSVTSTIKRTAAPARRLVKLFVLAGGVAHLLEHRLVEVPEREHLLLERVEVDAVHPC